MFQGINFQTFTLPGIIVCLLRFIRPVKARVGVLAPVAWASKATLQNLSNGMNILIPCFPFLWMSHGKEVIHLCQKGLRMGGIPGAAHQLAGGNACVRLGDLVSGSEFVVGDIATVLVLVFGTPGGGDVKLFVRPEGSETIIEEALNLVEGEWTTFTVPVSEFDNPAAITELGIRNMEVEDNVVHMDDLMIIEE